MPATAEDCNYGPAYEAAAWTCVGGSAAGQACSGWGDPVCVGGSCELGPGGATGDASFPPDSCAFFAEPFAGVYRAAISVLDSDGSAACGTCLEVSRPPVSILVEVTALCPACPAGLLELEVDAYELLADLGQGIVEVSWRTVPCPWLEHALAMNGSGVSNWWYSVSFDSHRHGIATVDLRGAGESVWTATTRTNDNFFVDADGLGPPPLDVRITDVTGGVLTALDVIHNYNGFEVFDLGGQLPECVGSEIFSDGFESGDTLAWSSSIP